jgi:hypothetical protein
MAPAIAASRLAPARAAAQLLNRPRELTHPADVAREICGAQAQDPRAGRLAFRARNPRLTAADVDRARTEERSLVRTWAMRNTMHLLAADDLPWIGPLFEPGLERFARRRLGHFGVGTAAADRALALIGKALESDGPLSRGELERRLAATGLEITPERRMHLVALAVSTRVACLGPDEGSVTLMASAREWLGERPPHDRSAALAELARRYLRAFGPATEVDFAGWAGLALGPVREGLAAIAAEIDEVRCEGTVMLRLRRRARRANPRAVRLLPGWDTYLMGHRERGFIAPPGRWERINLGGGMLRPAILAGGAAAGTWRARRSGGRIQIELEPFGPLSAEVRGAADAEVADIARFEGLETRHAT